MKQPRRRRRGIRHTGIALGLAGLLVALLAVGGASRSFPLTSIDFARGQTIFVQRCASCHAVEPHARAALGPHLGKIGQEAANRVAGQTAEQYLLTSIVNPAAFRAEGGNGIMPADVSAGLSAVDVASLIGYLMKQGAQPNPRRLVEMLPNISARPAVETEPVDFAEAEAGRKLFLGKAGCLACHPLQALPGHGLRAPSLLAAGFHDRAYLERSIRNPQHELTRGYENWQVVLTTGQVFTGRLLAEDEQQLELLVEESGRMVAKNISKALLDLEEQQGKTRIRMPQSDMPQGIAEKLTAEEIRQLVTFLKTLRTDLMK